MCTVIQHVPATESKVEPVRDNDQSSSSSCTGKIKMAAISVSGACAAAFDWNDLDRKRKLLAILMMLTKVPLPF